MPRRFCTPGWAQRHEIASAIQHGLIDRLPAAPLMAAVPPEASPVLARMEAEAMARLFGGKTPRVRRALLDAVAPPRDAIAGRAEEALVVMRVVTRRGGG